MSDNEGMDLAAWLIPGPQNDYDMAVGPAEYEIQLKDWVALVRRDRVLEIVEDSGFCRPYFVCGNDDCPVSSQEVTRVHTADGELLWDEVDTCFKCREPVERKEKLIIKEADRLRERLTAADEAGSDDECDCPGAPFESDAECGQCGREDCRCSIEDALDRIERISQLKRAYAAGIADGVELMKSDVTVRREQMLGIVTEGFDDFLDEVDI